MNIDEFLHIDAPAERVATLVRRAFADTADGEEYIEVLGEVVANDPPAFAMRAYADAYFAQARSGQWVAISLMTAAQDEGGAATALWEKADACDSQGVGTVLRRHAAAQAAHGRECLSLLDLCFPGAVSTEFRDQLGVLCPDLPEDGALPMKTRVNLSTADMPAILGLHISSLRRVVRILLRDRALESRISPGNQSACRALMTTSLDRAFRQVVETIIPTGATERPDLTPMLRNALREHIRTTAEDPIDLSYHRRFGLYP